MEHTEQHVHILQHNSGVLYAALDIVIFVVDLKYLYLFLICVINKEIWINHKPVIQLSQCHL